MKATVKFDLKDEEDKFALDILSSHIKVLDVIVYMLDEAEAASEFNLFPSFEKLVKDSDIMGLVHKFRKIFESKVIR